MTIYNVPLPASIEIYLNRLRELVNLEMIHPDLLLKHINPEWSVEKYLNLGTEKLTSSQESSGLVSTDLIFNLAPYLSLAVIVIAIIAIGIILSIFRSDIRESVLSGIQDIFFNGFIKYSSIIYLKVLVVLGAQVYNSEEIKFGPMMIAPMMAASYPLIALFILLLFSDKLNFEQVR